MVEYELVFYLLKEMDPSQYFFEIAKNVGERTIIREDGKGGDILDFDEEMTSFIVVELLSVYQKTTDELLQSLYLSYDQVMIWSDLTGETTISLNDFNFLKGLFVLHDLYKENHIETSCYLHNRRNLKGRWGIISS